MRTIQKLYNALKDLVDYHNLTPAEQKEKDHEVIEITDGTFSYHDGLVMQAQVLLEDIEIDENDIEFSQEVLNHLINGGTIIDHEYRPKLKLRYVLIRMPKDKKVMYDGTEFEYLECHNSPENFNDVVVMTCRNGDIREVKRKFNESFNEDRYYYSKRLEKMES